VEYLRQGEYQKAWDLVHEEKYWMQDAGLLSFSAFLSLRKASDLKAEKKLARAFTLDRSRSTALMDQWVWKLNRSSHVRYEMNQWFGAFKKAHPASKLPKEIQGYRLVKFLMGIILGFLAVFFTFTFLAPSVGPASIIITVLVFGFMVFGALRTKDLSWRPFFYGVGSSVFLAQIIVSGAFF
jgi:hypothetical protein